MTAGAGPGGGAGEAAVRVRIGAAGKGSRGAGVVLVLGLVGVLVLAASAVCLAGLAMLARHRAEAAADLAALAAASGAVPDCGRAALIAAQNGARLAQCVVGPDGSVTVTVRLPVPALSRALPEERVDGPVAVARARAGYLP